MALVDVGDEVGRLVDELPQLRLVVEQLAEEAAGRREGGIEVDDSGVGLLGAARVGRAESPDDVAQAVAGLGVEDVEDLVEVDGGRRVLLGDRPPVLDLRGGAGRELEIDVAVGDARQGGGANDRLGPAAQGVLVVVDLDLDLGLTIVGQGDVLDLPHLRARDLNEVALDELGGVLEAQRVGVAAVTGAEKHDRDRRRHHDDGANSRDPAHHARLHGVPLSPSLSHPRGSQPAGMLSKLATPRFRCRKGNRAPMRASFYPRMRCLKHGQGRGERDETWLPAVLRDRARP